MIKTSEDFYQAVKMMRTAQKLYFQTRSPSACNSANRYEAEIDRFIKERDERIANKKQGDLFKGGGAA